MDTTHTTNGRTSPDAKTATTASAPTAAKRPLVVRRPGEGEAVWFLDNLLTMKVHAREGAPFGLLEASLPAGSTTPFHAHHGEDEAFYVLEGEITFFVEAEGQKVLRCGPGTYVHVPQCVAHGFRTESAVRMLVVTGVDGFVEMAREAGMPAPRLELPPAGPPDFARLEAAARRCRIELLGPLPG